MAISNLVTTISFENAFAFHPRFLLAVILGNSFIDGEEALTCRTVEAAEVEGFVHGCLFPFDFDHDALFIEEMFGDA